MREEEIENHPPGQRHNDMEAVSEANSGQQKDGHG